MSRLTPEEAASGLGRPSVAELIALIHRVNPTGRGLSPEQEADRYALKARLQSRLIRDYGEHLQLRLEQADPGSEPIVSIEHRGFRRDAAHVPLSALDPDARDRVLQTLGLPEPTTPPAAPSSMEGFSASGDALSQGRAALEAWDYEAARAHFEAAWAETRGDAALHALLELLVEHLALDEDALRLSIPEPLLTARVARLLALAHARSGDVRHAAALLRRLDPVAEAEVRVLLAQRAVRNNAIGEVRSQLDALRELDPANGALADIASSLAALEAQERAPLEAALASALQAGDADAIRAAADALLAVAPAHSSARAALQRLAAQRRSEEVRALLASAESHAEVGRWELAIADLQKAGERRQGA